MTETPLTMSIDMSLVVAADDCPHYLTVEEAEKTTICAWCALRTIRAYGRPGQSGPNTGTVRQAPPGPRRATGSRWVIGVASEEEAA